MPEPPGNVSTRITLDGPFFTHDPEKRIGQNIQDMLEALAAEMQETVREDIASRRGSMPGWTGWSLEHTIGRVSSLSGKHWTHWANISTSAAQVGGDPAVQIRTLAAAATIERRWHPYRRMKSGVFRRKALLRDLAKGLE
jgi:hypothetical protein